MTPLNKYSLEISGYSNSGKDIHAEWIVKDYAEGMALANKYLELSPPSDKISVLHVSFRQLYKLD